MLTLFLQGLALGYGACMPIGPINILIISHALKSYKHAVALGFGAMSADVVYLFLMIFGLLKFFEIPWVKNSLAIFGFFFLLVVAFMLFKSAGRHLSLKKELKLNGLLATFTKGFLLTMLNPYTVGFWLSIASLALVKSSVSMLLLGIVLSILSWTTLMPYFVWKSKRFISEKTAKYFSYMAGVVLVVFAFILLINTFILETI